MNHLLLANDHSELDALIDGLLAALDAGDVEQIYQRLDLFWARLAVHIRAEHLHLFPAILAARELPAQEIENGEVPPFEVIKNIIEQLQDDHNFFMRELISAVKGARRLRENQQITDTQEGLISDVREKVIAVHIRLKKHNDLEESEVYRWTGLLLNTSQQADLNGQLQKQLENLPPRFGIENDS